MIYIHYCPHCNSAHMLNGHKKHCPCCGYHLYEMDLPFVQYTELDVENRGKIIQEFAKTLKKD